MAPTGTMAVRAAAGSASPGAIWVPTLIATTCSTVPAVAMVLLLRGRARYAARPLAERRARRRAATDAVPDTASRRQLPRASPARSALAVAIGSRCSAAIAWQIAAPWPGVPWPAAPRSTSLKEIAESWLIPLLVAGLLLSAARRRARSTSRWSRARARRSTSWCGSSLSRGDPGGGRDVPRPRARSTRDPARSIRSRARSGFPAAALPMALLRPLSGSGAFAVMAEILRPTAPTASSACSRARSRVDRDDVLRAHACTSVGRGPRHAARARRVPDRRSRGIRGATVACHLFFG
jgi:hypothetical protein